MVGRVDRHPLRGVSNIAQALNLTTGDSGSDVKDFDDKRSLDMGSLSEDSATR